MDLAQAKVMVMVMVMVSEAIQSYTMEHLRQSLRSKHFKLLDARDGGTSTRGDRLGQRRQWQVAAQFVVPCFLMPFANAKKQKGLPDGEGLSIYWRSGRDSNPRPPA
jgi:hypothetical protein